MNYKKHYQNLIERAKNRTLDGYKESHHIMPRCLGGSDDKDNLVDLTAREHFIAHLLLWKIHPESYGLIKAIQMMCIGHKEQRSMNRMYGWLKEHFSTTMSLSQSGEGNSQFGTMWVYNLELRESKKILKTDEIPNGWQKGRIVDFELTICKQQEKELLKSEKLKRRQSKNEEVERLKKERQENKIKVRTQIIGLFEVFKSGNYNSVRDFCKKENIKFSVMTISNYWREYVDEYKNNSKEGTPFRINT